MKLFKPSQTHRETWSHNTGWSILSRPATGMLFFCLSLSTPIFAEPDGDLTVDLMNRMSTIEDENRNLYGKIEELQHELKIVTQKMEALSADVEFRLGDSKGAGDAKDPTTLGTATGAPTDKVAGDLTEPVSPMPDKGPLVPPAVPIDFPPEREKSVAQGVVIGEASTPNEKYERARSLLEQGDYTAAEHAFASFLKDHPKDKQASAAQYWLGVTFFVRGDHEKAASEFAKGYKAYPKSKKAPDTLLKMAKSLENLNRKADACATLDQLTSQFPKAHVKEVSSQRKKLKCKG